MKKLLPLLFLLLMLLLTACGGKEEKADSSGEIHPHSFTEQGFNATHHFLVCECGERDKVTPHDFNEDSFCQSCGFYIYDMGEGCYSISIPDEFGNIVHQMDFDAYDKVIYDWRAEYEYDDDKNPKRIWEYLDGVLQSEQIYLRCNDPESGTVYLSESIYFSEDGTQERILYDEHSRIRSIALINSVGEVITEDTYTYELDANGNCIHEISHTNGILSREIFYQYDDIGCTYPAHYIYYHENGQIESEYYFDAFGNEIA